MQSGNYKEENSLYSWIFCLAEVLAYAERQIWQYVLNAKWVITVAAVVLQNQVGESCSAAEV